MAIFLDGTTSLAPSLGHAVDHDVLKAWFRCQPCNEYECSEPPSDCTEYVKEPGYCSCCMTCAREEGESCGINLPRCRKGLQCEPLDADNPKSIWNSYMTSNARCIA